MKTEAPKSFTIDDNMLVMTVESKDTSYKQRCSKETYNAVVEAFEDFRQHSIEAIANDLDLPWTQTAVAIAFLKEKSLLEIKNRRNKAACQEIYEHAQEEWEHLAYQIKTPYTESNARSR